jgi:hypothetical protein
MIKENQNNEDQNLNKKIIFWLKDKIEKKNQFIKRPKKIKWIRTKLKKIIYGKLG